MNATTTPQQVETPDQGTYTVYNDSPDTLVYVGRAESECSPSSPKCVPLKPGGGNVDLDTSGGEIWVCTPSGTADVRVLFDKKEQASSLGSVTVFGPRA